MQTRSDKHIVGIDVSHHQGEIDWMKMRAAGVRFVYIKATEGVTYQDPAMQRHYIGAKRAGLKVGFYHYARPYNDPREEVKNLLATTRLFPHDLPYALDIETNEGKFGLDHITLFCKLWLSTIETRTGETPIVYTYTHFAKSYLDKELGKWPVWIAHYKASKPGDNGIWDTWAAWQYTSDNDGLPYPGRLDVNVMEPEFYTNWLPLPDVEGRCTVDVDDEGIDHGYIIDGRAYVPARALSDALGAKSVGWDGVTKTVKVVR